MLISFLGSDTNSYKGQDIRAQVMAPLKRLCEETGCTVIALRHLNKGQGAAIYRRGGSIGIVGAARAAFLMAKDPENGGAAAVRTGQVQSGSDAANPGLPVGG
ncbi:MAG: hypothetical protein ACLR9P_06980 [Escherichia coli]